MNKQLWKITGDGYYFSDFYVAAIDEVYALVAAEDILSAEQRFNELSTGVRYFTPGKKIGSHIKSVTPYNPAPSEVTKNSKTIIEITIF